MTLKKSIGISGVLIIVLSMVIALSFVFILIKLNDLEEKESQLIEHNDSINRRYIELTAWMDGMNEHVIEDWPFEGELNHEKSDMGKWIESYKPISGEDENFVSDLSNKNRELYQSARKIVNTEGLESKQEIYLDEYRPVADSIKPIIGGLANYYQENLTSVRDKRTELQKNAGFFIIIVSIITVIGVVFAILAIFRWVLRPLNHISEKITAVGRGDLGVGVDYKSKNEIGNIAYNFNKMVQILNRIIKGILTSSAEVVSALDILRERTQKTSEGARKQHNQTAQAATATEEMSATITEIAQSASVAADMSSGAIDTAEKGKEMADGAVETVNQVYNSTIELSAEIEKLNNSVLEIGNIITVINDIADQTNLLALNAAIEAARAGEQGRGFAVVADEVRKLAENTVKATAEISEKIGIVQKESEQTTRSMGDSTGKVTKAMEYIRNLGDSLHSIIESGLKVRDQITRIATAIDEQTAATDEVSSNIEHTAVISKDVDIMSEEILHEVNNLTHIAEELKNSATGFRTDGNEADFTLLNKELVHVAKENFSCERGKSSDA